MPEEFRYPDRLPPTPTSSVVLWLMACVVLVGSVVLGLTLADRDTVDTRLAARASSTAVSQIERTGREPVEPSPPPSTRSPTADRSPP